MTKKEEAFLFGRMAHRYTRAGGRAKKRMDTGVLFAKMDSFMRENSDRAAAGTERGKRLILMVLST